MSRVSEAMRRAGYRQDNHRASSPDELAFFTIEGPAEARVEDVIPYTESTHRDEEPRAQAPLAPAPIGPSRDGTGEDIRIEDVLRIVYRGRLLRCPVCQHVELVPESRMRRALSRVGLRAYRCSGCRRRLSQRNIVATDNQQDQQQVPPEILSSFLRPADNRSFRELIADIARDEREPIETGPRKRPAEMS